MDPLNLFYIVLFPLALIAAYTDYRYGKIKNMHLAIASVLGAALFAYIALGLADITYPWRFYVFSMTDTLAAFLFSFTLWHYGAWGGGDAKLYSLTAFLYPVGHYSKTLSAYFPSSTLFINAFIVACVILLMQYYIPHYKEIHIALKAQPAMTYITAFIMALFLNIILTWFNVKSILVLLLALLLVKILAPKVPFWQLLGATIGLIGYRIYTGWTEYPTVILQSLIIAVVFLFMYALIKHAATEFREEHTHFAVYLLLAVVVTLVVGAPITLFI